MRAYAPRLVVVLPLFALVGCSGTPAVRNSAERAAAALAAAAQAENAAFAQKAAKDGPSTETYKHFVDNPYFATAVTPRSTLGIAVDTASYSNVRDMLNQGRLPPKDAVRVADFLNYFPYAYPQPQGEHPVAFALNMTTCPWNAEHHLLRVALAARAYHPDQMPPRNLVFLLDTSGSMGSPNKLPLLVQSLKLLVGQLRPQDRVAIVVYAGSAGLVLPSTTGNEKEKIAAALDRLQAGGSTNGGQGIQLAYKIAGDHFVQGGVNRVILGSDGDFNVGVTSEGDLVRLIEEKRQSGVYLTILGFGRDNLKDATMERLAHHGNGHFAYIDTPDEARKLFVEQGGALTTVANDVKLQLEFNPARVAGYRLIGYENKVLRDQDFNNDAVDASDLGSGHTVTALYEIVPAGLPVPEVNVDPLKYQVPGALGPEAAKGEFVTVKLRYKNPGSDQSQLLEQPLAGAVEPLEAAGDDLRFAAAVAEFGLLLRESPYKGTASYDRVLATARAAVGTDPGGHRAEFVGLVTKARQLAGR